LLAANSTCKKLAVQWLNEPLYFGSSSMVADSFRLRNRQLLEAANRYKPFKKKLNINNMTPLTILKLKTNV
jgi:hypothetical protein